MKSKLVLICTLVLLVAACVKNSDYHPISIAHLTTEATSSTTRTPIADAYTRDGVYANFNFGQSGKLEVKSAKEHVNRTTYLKFSLKGLGSFDSAKLRVYSSTAQTFSLTAYSVADTWEEKLLTWNNAPQPAGAQGLLAINVGYTEVDVTAAAKGELAGDSVLSIALKDAGTRNAYVSFSSRETSHPPQLIFKNATASLPTVPEQPQDTISSAPSPAVSTSRPDHVFVVFEENKGFSQIVGSSSAPYINSLIKRGTLFTASHGVTHPSYPNYIAFFSGSTQGVNNDNEIVGQPYSAPNLYTALAKAGRSAAWYSEGLPSEGYEGYGSGDYREKHNPTTIFSTVPKSANKPLTAINLKDSSTFRKLPNVVFITPNMKSDMHDASVAYGDTWLKNNLSLLVEWCLKNNSVFIVTTDEDNKQEGNRIVTLAVGQHIKTGYKASEELNHYSFARWICEVNGAATDWHSNIKKAIPIQGIQK